METFSNSIQTSHVLMMILPLDMVRLSLDIYLLSLGRLHCLAD